MSPSFISITWATRWPITDNDFNAFTETQVLERKSSRETTNSLPHCYWKQLPLEISATEYGSLRYASDYTSMRSSLIFFTLI